MHVGLMALTLCKAYIPMGRNHMYGRGLCLVVMYVALLFEPETFGKAIWHECCEIVFKFYKLEPD